MPKVTILWGGAPEPGDKAKTYEFETQAELDAFMKGVEEMDGWMGWEYAEEDYVVPKEGHHEKDGF